MGPAFISSIHVMEDCLACRFGSLLLGCIMYNGYNMIDVTVVQAFEAVFMICRAIVWKVLRNQPVIIEGACDPKDFPPAADFADRLDLKFHEHRL